MTLSPFWLRLIASNKRSLAHRRDTLHPAPREAERLLLSSIAVMVISALLLCGLSGYHGAFHSINDASRLMPGRLLETITYCGDSLVALLLLLVCARRYPQVLWLGVVAAVIATLGSHALKSLLATPRPPAVLAADSFHLLGPGYRARSFPSGHTVTAFTAAGVLGYYAPRSLQWLLLMGALIVGMSRVAVGVHWPVDVLVGAALGLASVLAAGRLVQRWQWGLRPTGHHLLVLLLAGGAAGEMLRSSPYVGAHFVGDSLALIALLLVARDYLMKPAGLHMQMRPYYLQLRRALLLRP